MQQALRDARRVELAPSIVVAHADDPVILLDIVRTDVLLVFGPGLLGGELRGRVVVNDPLRGRAKLADSDDGQVPIGPNDNAFPARSDGWPVGIPFGVFRGLLCEGKEWQAE